MEWNIERNQPCWPEVMERFEAWWKRSSCGRPLMNVIARREEHCALLTPPPQSNEQHHIDPEYNVARYRDFISSHYFMADAFPNTNVNIGPGSLAVYLGSEPVFEPGTVWFQPCIKDWASLELEFDENNYWFKRHIAAIKRQRELSNGEFLVGIPDLLEGVDILAAMRGPLEFCYDLVDYPELIKKYLTRLNDLYHKYYEAFYEISKDDVPGNCYTCFAIWGRGRTIKLQCDFAALMNPEQFREFVVPYLRDQARHYDRLLYHFDGPGALQQLDAVLEIPEIDAVQWVPGAGNTLSGDEKWFWIYDKVRAAGKSLWIYLYDYRDFSETVAVADKLVKRYGNDGLYMLFPEMSKPEADALMYHAGHCWTH